MKNDEKVGLTACFYQNPFALEEIRAWEAKMWDAIVYKRRWQDKIFYLIEIPEPKEDRPKLELMIAIPMKCSDLIYSDIFAWGLRELRRISLFHISFDDELIFGKTILFGAADSRILKRIADLTKFLEESRVEQECEEKIGAMPT